MCPPIFVGGHGLCISLTLQRYKFFFFALTPGTAPVVGKLFELCSNRDIMLRVALRGIINVTAGALVAPAAQAYGIKFIIILLFLTLESYT